MKSFPPPSRLVVGSLIGLAALACAYGLYGRATIARQAPPLHAPEVLDVVLETLCSPQFVLFILVPTWLGRAVLSTRVELAPDRLTRHGSYRAALTSSIQSSARALAVSAAAVLAGLLTASAGLPLIAQGDHHLLVPETVTAAYSTDGILPWVALAMQSVQLAGVLLIIHAAVMSAAMLGLPFALRVTAALAVWVWAASATLGGFTEGSFLSAQTYAIFRFVPSDPLRSAGALAAAGAMIVAIVVAALYLDTRSRHRGRRLPGAAVFGILSASIVFGLVAQSQPWTRSFQTVIKDAFSGDGGTLLQYAGGIVLLVGYVFLFSSRLAEVRSGWALLLLIRQGSMSRWARHVAVRESIAAALFIVAILACSAVSYVLLGGKDFGGPAGSTPLWLFHFVVNWTLQLLVYLAAVFVAVLLSGRRLAGLMAVGTITALSAPQIQLGPWLPVQAADMYLTAGGWSTVLVSTASLLVWSLTISALLALVIRRRLVVL
ncbi:hypothetical protein [Cryobacterium sp. Y57]|uniref:hypothetical protein n=1 Tax=Cryobacterium sp. Y57 TaxID=2048287 RepID=UPI000CE4110F|nr:hypothetical protein [Cryobacterium sp. Y57]